MKAELYAHFARVGKSVASPARLEILDLLAQGEKPVERIAEQARLTVKNASAHLRELRSARLVETRREGTYVFYRLADPAVFDLLRALQRLGRARLAEVEQIARRYLDADDLEQVSIEDLHARIGRGDVTLIDVRPADEYAAGHLPGAISVPIEELDDRITGLPVRGEVVAYCRGPYCVYAVDAVRKLRAAGIRARRMEDGLPDWRARGLPVSEGTAARSGVDPHP